MVVKIEGLEKKFKGKAAVDGLELSVNEGEIFGLLGPNGAGKSTTLNMMLGLLKSDHGTVSLFGKDFRNHSKEIKQMIGYVPQDFAFFETLSALDNVKYWGRLYQLKGKELDKAVKDALEFTGLWERRKDKAKNYSGGMKRRLNIACAVVHKPKLLLMDEPTVGVDPQSRNNILESIQKLNKQGTTVIYTSHYMEEIEAICDRVVIMDFGKKIAEGTVEELVESCLTERTVCFGFKKNADWVGKILEKVEGVIRVKDRGNEVQVTIKEGEENLGRVLSALTQNQIKPLYITSEQANLESVFLKLTGKKLRD